MLKVGMTHYNGARPHMALGLVVPDPPTGAVLRVDEPSRHHLGAGAVVCVYSVPGGWHHEYSRARTALIEYLRTTRVGTSSTNGALQEVRFWTGVYFASVPIVRP